MEETVPSDTITPPEDLTPDEKRSLLFNVSCSLEIPMEDFDKNWWPLVSNIWTQWNSHTQVNGNVRKVFACRFTKHRVSSTRSKENIPNEKRRVTKIRPSKICNAKIRVWWLVSLKIVKVERYNNFSEHTHSLLKSDRLKRSQATRTLVEKEAVKNYSPPAITSAIKEYASKLGLGASVSELKRKEVANIKYKVRGPMEAHLTCNSGLRSDISESVSFLIEKGYQVENYCVFHQSAKTTKGFVFAYPKQLEKLQRHGWLTLIDSTHKMNKYDWRLFTLYVRDTYGSWDVGAHFFVSNEDCDTVSEALKIIRSKCRQWSPRYFLLDQSGIEAKGIKKAFPGISAGEQQCDVILCVVHVMRTWMTKIYDKKTRDIMNAAMHKRTKVGCEKLVQDAINGCAISAIRNYIQQNYAKNTQQWALWARQHSPLLLQVTSTNPLESYHNELKRLTSFSHGLIGAAHNIINVDCKKRSESEVTAFDFRTKKISAYGVDNDIIEKIHKFPFPLQRLLVEEARAVMSRIEKGREIIIEFVQTKEQKEAENRRLSVVELTEKIRDKYWNVEEMGNAEKTEAFISIIYESYDIQDNTNSYTLLLQTPFATFLSKFQKKTAKKKLKKVQQVQQQILVKDDNLFIVFSSQSSENVFSGTKGSTSQLSSTILSKPKIKSDNPSLIKNNLL
ncbi:hypothetical protein GLOIN_2v1777773 [Rhizophagus clarus]|uniref:ZSWIM1/3 RNaseH-like domain-containing protein n=1 Tax=Rhizophagus clarus TaxID=94130 RepID=A0A8H3M573_9GLOM|nr:hypothetical protein GLOIN_2v1777773 [Rhizophagus clarus]